MLFTSFSSLITLTKNPAFGRVILVGAGAGDPDLLTLKAARVLKEARLVLFDHLVSKDVLQLVSKEAELIYVGKQSGLHTLTQEGIIQLMLERTQKGQSLVRLKGGDPFIFGRGGEEIEALHAAGISCEVVPGISAIQAAAASVGFSLTHRNHADALVFVTGHSRGLIGERYVDLDWVSLSKPRQTVVIYMGLSTLPTICQKLIEHGSTPQTPAALIENASLPTQRTVLGTLQTLPTLSQTHQIKPPALIVIGSVLTTISQNI